MTMNWESAELTKYAANAMARPRISFMNEMTILCEGAMAPTSKTSAKASVHDNRIGPAFLAALVADTAEALLPQGRGRGWSISPARSATKISSSRRSRQSTPIRKNASSIKIEQKLGTVRCRVRRSASGDWPLKADTDDIRESAALDVIRYLLDKGARIKATDPKAMENMKQIFKDEVEWVRRPL